MSTTDSVSRGSRTQRLDIRMTPQVRSLIVRAANLSGTSLSDYVTTVSLEAAKRDIAADHVLSVSSSVWEEFVAALDQPDYSGLDEALSRPTIWDAA